MSTQLETMTPFALAKMLLVVIATSWIFHAIGGVIAPEKSEGFAWVGAAVASLAIVIFVVLTRASERVFIFIGAMLTTSIVVGAGVYAATYPWLWVGLVSANVPVCLHIAHRLFDDRDDFLFSLSSAFKGEGIPQTHEEGMAGLKGLLFLIACAMGIAAEYQLVVFLFLNP